MILLGLKRFYKYLIILVTLIISVSLFSGVSHKAGNDLDIFEQEAFRPIQSPKDSTVRNRVRKTQITNFEDLKENPPIDLKDPSNVENKIEYDPILKRYIFTTKIGDQIISTPFSLTEEEYQDYSLQQSMSKYFRDKNAKEFEAKGDKEDFSLKDIKLSIGPAEKLFGPGGIQVKTQGSVEATAGIKYNSLNDPTIPQRNRSKTMFDFKEDIQLNVNASVGDKMNFGMNYDTKAMFDFDSKKLKLGYQGKEDEIIKAIEAGNVSMATTNSLINGGTALFGIRTELQFGKFKINTVLSQQEAQAQSVNSKGSVQLKEFEFKADQYDENRYFFLGHYFRDNYDKAMNKLPYINSPVTITRMEVWVTNKKADPNEARNIVAFADMAEYDKIENKAWAKSPGAINAPYNDANNLYRTIISTFKLARDIGQTSNVLEGILPYNLENGRDFEKLENARLLKSSEYTFDPQLGYIALNSALNADEVLAVAYEYRMNNGKDYKVGEFSSDIVDKYDPSKPASGALFVKLLKPVSMSPSEYTWHLMMKNVYNIGAMGIQKERFQMHISYQSDTLGTYINYLPEGKIKNQLLLRVMMLDSLNSQNKRFPDGVFDFVNGYTINADQGRIIFPVVEPFGSHLAKKIGDPTTAAKYTYQELYDTTKTAAQQIAEKNKFKIYGKYQGSSSMSSDIDLNATNIPQGSVKVTAGGALLTEGVDYIVDYQSGTVTIINEALKNSNTPIQTSLENRTFSMQRRTLMGANLSYDFSKDFSVGGTIMHMYEKPLTMKSEMGTESAKNTLWGFNVSYRKESEWLTNLVDKLPFVEATQPSQITFIAEFAHLKAGHYENKDVGAYSYIDDFESSESKIDLKSPYGWSLSSTPMSKKDDGTLLFPNADKVNDISYGKERARLAWFMIDGLFTRNNSSRTPQHIKDDEKNILSDHFVREVKVDEIYPNRDRAFNDEAILPVLNLSFYPKERGPYNLDDVQIDSDGKLLNPKTRWGGITRKLDVRDFENANVEYLEFWLMDPFVYNGTGKYPNNNGGKLYFNLGEISEDILKDGKKFYENGLPVNDDPTATVATQWGLVPARQSTIYAFDDNLGADARKKQDVGFNGLSSDKEQTFVTYKTYIDNLLTNKLGVSTINEMRNDLLSPLNDPAGDDFRFYLHPEYDRNKTGILDRYKYYNNVEGNSQESTNSGQTYSTAGKRVPDVEDIDQDYTMNEREAYYEYIISLVPDSMQVGKNYIVEKKTVPVPLRNGNTEKVNWYQFKIPLRSAGKAVNNIKDFRSIRFARMFMTDFTEDTFLRFGALQLVRGDWRVYKASLNKNGTSNPNTSIDLSTVNIEENSKKEPVSYVLPPGVSRSLDPDQTQLIEQNEQSLSLKVSNLDPEDARAAYKNASYDLRKYKRLQMFVHAEELIGGSTLLKGELTAFIRLGSDYKNNYYEYEVPLTVTPKGVYTNDLNDRGVVWPKDNMFDIVLDSLKNVKLKRNKEKRKAGSTVSFTSLFSSYDSNNKISVIGNPSLSEINVIMIGVRNNSRTAKSGEVWFNELRLTDFDEKGGWAAQGNLNIALSDLATINFSARKETVGFGGIDQRLMERRTDDYYMYNISANVELGKFLPEKAKANIPLYYSYSNETISPEYDPFDKDVKLKESLNLVDTKTEKDSIKSLAQEKVTTKSFSLNNVKSNVQSKTPMPYDPTNLSLGYSFNQTENNNPTTKYDISKNYKASLGYNYAPIMKTWEPFKNTKSKSAVSKFGKSLGLNYLPSNISFNSIITRYYTETNLRDIENYSLGGTNDSEFLTWNQSFYWDRDFNLNWDFTRNLKFSFQSGTRAEIVEPYSKPVNKKLSKDAYENWKDSVMMSIKSLGEPLNYKQNVQLTYQLPLRAISALDWITSNVNYSSYYNWDRGAEINDLDLGNSINNNLTLDFTNRFNLVNLYNKSSYLKKINSRFEQKRNQTPKPKSILKKEKPLTRSFTQEVILQKDTALNLIHALNSKKLEVMATHKGKQYKLKYKVVDENTIKINSKDTALIKVVIRSKAKNDDDEKSFLDELAAYSARGLMSIRSLSINFTKQNETHISGFSPSVGDVFGQKNSPNGLTPGFGFAFGLDGGDDFIEKSLRNGWLSSLDNNIPAVFNSTEKFDLKMSLEPIKGMKVELTAVRENVKRTDVQFTSDGMPRSLGGNFTMTTIALSTSLRSSNSKNGYNSAAFNKFLSNIDVLKNRMEFMYVGQSYPNVGFINDLVGLGGNSYIYGTANSNSPDVLIPAFVAAYTGKNAKKIGFSPFPSLLSMLPNWAISYDGLSELPLIKDKFKSIRLNHKYVCFYNVSNYTSFASWVGVDDDLGFIRDALTGDPVPSSPFNISSVNITERFSPLFGVDGILNNNMTMNAQYNNMRTLDLNLAAYQIIEGYQRDLVVGIGYRINEFNKILGIYDKNSKGFNNDLNIKADLSHKTNQILIRKIQERFTQATSGTTILTLKLSADYTLSRSITLRAFYDRILNKPLVTSSGYPKTDSNFGISLRFSLLQ